MWNPSSPILHVLALLPATSCTKEVILYWIRFKCILAHVISFTKKNILQPYVMPIQTIKNHTKSSGGNIKQLIYSNIFREGRIWHSSEKCHVTFLWDGILKLQLTVEKASISYNLNLPLGINMGGKIYCNSKVINSILKAKNSIVLWIRLTGGH